MSLPQPKLLCVLSIGVELTLFLLRWNRLRPIGIRRL
jgi:hypothetical protein